MTSTKSTCPVRLLCKLLPFERFRNPAPVVPVLRLSGVIASEGFFKPGLCLDSLNESIEQAFKTKNLACVALLINSPGGAATQSALIYRRIRQLALEKQVPVIAFVEDVAASGGYWLACSADEIIAMDTSVVGSIGVITSLFGFPEAIKKLGIERRVYTQGKNKSVLDPFLPEKASDVDIIHSLQKDAHESFKSMIRERRQGKLKADEDTLFNGEFWSGAKALELGLIDGLGDMHNVLTSRYGEKVKIRKITKSKNLLKRLLGSYAPSLSRENLVEEVFQALENRSFWNRFGL